MKIHLKDVETGKLYEGKILESSPSEMPLRKNGWQFTWEKLAKVEGAQVYKITLNKSPDAIEGVLMITLINDEMLYMSNMEIAPHNYGKRGDMKISQGV